jgi:hypothetical protein
MDHICCVCQRPFTKEEWEDRHGHGKNSTHLECCPKCNSGWIDVNKKIPPAGHEVWLLTEEMGVVIGRRFSVTHWQPLIKPDPPKLTIDN